MGTNLRVAQVYAADPIQVLEMLTNKAYINARAMLTGSLSVESSSSVQADGTINLEIIRTLRSQMPSFAVAIAGETLTVTEHQSWQPATQNSCRGTFRVDFSAPLTFLGVATMTYDGAHTTVVTEGDFKASIPFFGGKVENLAREQTQRYLEKEESFANDWLKNHDPTE
jgi:hypothetical protein